MLRVPGQVFARQLPLDEFGIFGEEKDSPLQTDHVRALLNGSVQQRVVHPTILPQSQGAVTRTERAFEVQLRRARYVKSTSQDVIEAPCSTAEVRGALEADDMPVTDHR